MLNEMLTTMFKEVYNRNEVHFSQSKTFPRECFSEICMILSDLNELSESNNIHCDVKLHFGTCKVSFTYFDNNGIDIPFDKKVRDEFREKGII